jgi:hypothetical protein
MTKFFLWMKNAGGFAAYIALTIILGLAGYMYASIIFHLDNFYSKDVHAASGWWHVGGWILTGAAIAQEIVMNERASIIFFGVTVGLSWLCFTGFNI